MTEAMEHELRLALDIADSLVSTKIELIKSNAANVSIHILRTNSAKEMTEVMASLLAEHTEFLSLTVLDRHGIVADYGRSACSPEVYAESVSLQKALAGEIDISAAHYDEKHEHFIMHIFMPIGRDLVLSATIPALTLSNLVSDFRLWNTGNIFIVDAESTIIANDRIDLVYERYNFIEEGRTNPYARDTGVFFRNMISTDTGSGRYRFYGQERLCVYKRVSSADVSWYIGVVAPINESPMQNVQNGLMLASLIFLAMGVAVSVFVSGAVIKPFKTIQEQAEQIHDEHERARLLLNATPLACRLMKRLGGGKYELFECNEESVKLFKFKDKREFMERYFEIYPECQPDGRNSITEGQKLVEKAYTDGRYVTNFVFQTADGESVPAEVTLVRLKYGNDYIIAGYTRDMREQTRMMNDIKKRDSMLDTMNLVAGVLLATADEENFEEPLAKGMELIGQYLEADSVQIWSNEMIDGELNYTLKSIWLSEAGRKTMPVSVGTTIPYSASWKELFLQGKCINGPTSSLPQEDQDVYYKFGIVSTITIPLFLREKFWGLFCVDDSIKERYYSESEIGILNSAGLMLVNAINRSLQAAQIHEAHSRTRLLFDTTPLAVNLWDSNMNLFECNEESVRLFNMKDKQDYLDNFRSLSPEFQPDGSRSLEKTSLIIKKAFEEGKCVFEWMHQTQDGVPIPSEITLVRVAYGDDFAVAGYVRDLREQKAMMNEINQKSSLLDSMNKAANKLLQSDIDDFEDNLQLCMGMIGRAVNADRMSIWKNSVKDGKLHCTMIDEWIAHEWTRTSSEISIDVPYEGNIPTFEQILTRGECVNSLIRDLSPMEQSRMEMHKVKSVFVAPVFVHDEFWGFVGCDNCHDETVFTDEVATTLRSGSLLIANALVRN